MREDLTIKQFIERAKYLPLEEAEIELVMRKEQSALELAMLQTELHRLGELGTGKKRKSLEATNVGRAMCVVHADLTLISETLRAVRARLNGASWRNAVKAVYGSEGYEKCRLWMAINTPMEPARAEEEIAHLRSKGVTLDA